MIFTVTVTGVNQHLQDFTELHNILNTCIIISGEWMNIHAQLQSRIYPEGTTDKVWWRESLLNSTRVWQSKEGWVWGHALSDAQGRVQKKPFHVSHCHQRMPIFTQAFYPEDSVSRWKSHPAWQTAERETRGPRSQADFCRCERAALIQQTPFSKQTFLKAIHKAHNLSHERRYYRKTPRHLHLMIWGYYRKS